MRLGDDDSVYALWLGCPGKGLNNLDDSREGIARYLAWNPETCFVAVEQGIHKVNLVVFAHNDTGNAFWERMGFTQRPDLVYRNRTLAEMVRMDT